MNLEQVVILVQVERGRWRVSGVLQVEPVVSRCAPRLHPPPTSTVIPWRAGSAVADYANNCTSTCTLFRDGLSVCVYACVDVDSRETFIRFVA